MGRARDLRCPSNNISLILMHFRYTIASSHIDYMMSIKNEIEIEGFRRAYLCAGIWVAPSRDKHVCSIYISLFHPPTMAIRRPASLRARLNNNTNHMPPPPLQQCSQSALSRPTPSQRVPNCKTLATHLLLQSVKMTLNHTYRLFYAVEGT